MIKNKKKDIFRIYATQLNKLYKKYNIEKIKKEIIK